MTKMCLLRTIKNRMPRREWIWKIEKAQVELADLRKLFEEKRLELGNNFYEYKQGQDLSLTFSHLSQIEQQQLDLEKEIGKLKLQNSSPYFARIDFKTTSGLQKIYIGLGSIIGNKKVYAVDWRSPIASMYYEYELGNAQYTAKDKIIKGQLTLKRQYKIENQQLLSYFDTNLTINDEILQQILSKNASDKMRQIVSTIQKEQNEIVEFLDKQCTGLDEVIKYRKQIIEKLEEYKKSLIYECVTGKREV